MAPRIQLDHHIHHEADDDLKCRLERLEHSTARIELRQIFQNRASRRIERLIRKLPHGNPADQAMKDQVLDLIHSTTEKTRKLEDAVPPQER